MKKIWMSKRTGSGGDQLKCSNNSDQWTMKQSRFERGLETGMDDKGN